MRILVTGATGRIGVHLTHRLVDAGHDVVALVMPGDPNLKRISDRRVSIIEGVINDLPALATAAAGVDAVFHLAAALPSRGNTDDDFFQTNLRGTFDLLCAIRDHAPNVRRFVYVSSDTVYSNYAGDRTAIQDETTPKRPKSVYGASKAAAEEICFAFHRMHGIPVTVIRPGGTLDANELITPGSVFARQLYVQDAIHAFESRTTSSAAQSAILSTLREISDGTARQLFIEADLEGRPEICHWGDARDVASGMLLTLENRLADGEIFILSGPSPFSKGELVRYIAERTGYSFVEARLPTADSPWRLSHAKAAAILGYRPQHSVFDMIDQALGTL